MEPADAKLDRWSRWLSWLGLKIVATRSIHVLRSLINIDSLPVPEVKAWLKISGQRLQRLTRPKVPCCARGVLLIRCRRRRSLSLARLPLLLLPLLLPQQLGQKQALLAIQR